LPQRHQRRWLSASTRSSFAKQDLLDRRRESGPGCWNGDPCGPKDRLYRLPPGTAAEWIARARDDHLGRLALVRRTLAPCAPRSILARAIRAPPRDFFLAHSALSARPPIKTRRAIEVHRSTWVLHFPHTPAPPLTVLRTPQRGRRASRRSARWT